MVDGMSKSQNTEKSNIASGGQVKEPGRVIIISIHELTSTNTSSMLYIMLGLESTKINQTQFLF